MQSTRERILQFLQKKPRTTIIMLAEAVGINPISVRHHLTNLQIEGLVTAEEERHGVGRPRLIYLLTEHGMERFPTRYMRLTSRLLDQLKSSMPAPLVKQLFQQMATDMAEEYKEEMKGMSMDERLIVVKTLLAKEGFDIEWERTGEGYSIHEVNCPYLKIGQNHPEVCTVDQMLISTMLAVPAEKVQCILNGDAKCTYLVQMENKV
jgi:DeoR family suf operon transcriptional repressor